jgi:hypothetical protein
MEAWKKFDCIPHNLIIASPHKKKMSSFLNIDGISWLWHTSTEQNVATPRPPMERCTNLKVGETVYLKAWVTPKYQLWNVGLIPGTLKPHEANISLEWLKTNALRP